MRKHMFQISLLGCFLLVSMFVISVVSAGCGANLGHPAAAYCTELGYDYEITETSIGQKGICVIQGNEFDAWDFLNGKVGEEYSYCVLNGYEQITKTDGQNPYSREYAVCVLDEREIGQVHELMDLESRIEGGILPEIDGDLENYEEAMPSPLNTPPSFDWRDYGGINWMTSVKDQGSCGSCWAFGVLGNVEALHNIKSVNPDLDLDLSEQHLISNDGDCCDSCGDCDEGFSSPSLLYIRDEGVVDESCFPYTESNSPCDLCGDWENKVTYIDDYMAYYQWGEENIKQSIVENSPVILYVGTHAVDWDPYWDGDLYKCHVTSGVPDHSVVVVGYDDVGEYWIAKNSWGDDWNGDGYFKIGYGECGIETYTFGGDVIYPPILLDSVVLTPENPLPNQDLICTGNVFYAGEEEVGAAYSFLQNGNAPSFIAKTNCQPSSDNHFDCVGILPSRYTNPDEEWQCLIGIGEDNWFNSNIVTILDSPGSLFNFGFGRPGIFAGFLFSDFLF